MPKVIGKVLAVVLVFALAGCPKQDSGAADPQVEETEPPEIKEYEAPEIQEYEAPEIEEYEWPEEEEEE